MKVDIKPYWMKLTRWYWDENTSGMSIWEMLQHEYGAFKAFNIGSLRDNGAMWVLFPDKESY